MAIDRLSRLEGAYDQVDQRLTNVERSIDALRADMKSEMGGLRAEMNGLRTEMNSRFNNMYALMGLMWATVLAGVITLALK